ncbi:MAG: hypothetical protein IPK58_00355 [Acidobacteria bacterium]|nr:hypothetical protein [Acidobacteriota bacterium]
MYSKHLYSRIPDIHIPDIPDIRIPEFQTFVFQIPELYAFVFQIPEFQTFIFEIFQIPDIPDSRYSRFQTFELQNSRYSYSRYSRFQASVFQTFEFKYSRYSHSRYSRFQNYWLSYSRHSYYRFQAWNRESRCNRVESVPSAVADGWTRHFRTAVLIPTDLQPSATADGIDSSQPLIERPIGFFKEPESGFHYPKSGI